MARLPAKNLDRGVLPSLLGYVLRRTQSAVFADFAGTFSKAGEALTPGEFGLLVLVERNAGLPPERAPVSPWAASATARPWCRS